MAVNRSKAESATARQGPGKLGAVTSTDRPDPDVRSAPDGWLGALVARSGYRREEPVVVGVQHRGGPPGFWCQGRLSDGAPPAASTLAYAASLSKQVTAAAAALLVHQGVLDIDSPLSRWLPELPGWARKIRLRHLVHHTAGLPDDDDVDAAIAGDRDRTTAGILRALARHEAPAGLPGSAYHYSNAGYVCLAASLERAAGQQLPELTRRHLFEPLALTGTRLWAGPRPAPPGAAALTGPHPAPLSLGDGGLWSTAADLLRWSRALNADQLGLAATLDRPGLLADGTPVDYAWGAGIRSRAGYRVYRHGGGWRGLRALLARVPDLHSSLVVLALADDTERRLPLANGILDEIVRHPDRPVPGPGASAS